MKKTIFGFTFLSLLLGCFKTEEPAASNTVERQALLDAAAVNDASVTEASTEATVPHPEFELSANSGNSNGMVYIYNTPLKTTELLRNQTASGVFQCSHTDDLGVGKPEYFATYNTPVSWTMKGFVEERKRGSASVVTAITNVYSSVSPRLYTTYSRNLDGTVSVSTKSLTSSDRYVDANGNTYYLYVVCASKIRGDIANINGNLIAQ